jgi:hypothetical protein
VDKQLQVLRHTNEAAARFLNVRNIQVSATIIAQPSLIG